MIYTTEVIQRKLMAFSTRIVVLPRITAQAFISFQWFFMQAIKWDRRLLEDSCAVCNLMLAMNSDGSRWCVTHYTMRFITLQCYIYPDHKTRPGVDTRLAIIWGSTVCWHSVACWLYKHISILLSYQLSKCGVREPTSSLLVLNALSYIPNWV